MLSNRSLFKISFYLIFATIFIFGGFLQFFFGISNTGLTFGLIAIMLLNYLIYVLINQRILFNYVSLFFWAYILIIVISGIINEVSLIKILIYTLYPFLPYSIYLFFFINNKRSYISSYDILKLITLIAVIQLPIILIQKYFFGFLIQFNRSSQEIAPVDFLFGSFFLKSDHSLGFFLIMLISAILLNINRIKERLKYPIAIVIYLSITILFSESNISKGLLVIIWALIIFLTYYNRLRHSSLFYPISLLIILSTGIILYSIRDISFVQQKLGGQLHRHFSVEQSYKFYKERTAKREHIVVVFLNVLDLKLIGEGPYSYFNILTGNFKHTIHFSQIIWTYFDLGIIGLLNFFMYLWSLVGSMKIRDWIGRLSIFGLCVFYSFYTAIFSEIAIVFSLFLIIQKVGNEFDIYPVSRLEKI